MNKIKKLADYKSLATKCQRNHICLEDTSKVLCKTDYCVNNEVLFVKHEGFNGCPYLHSFGYSHFCSCPLRMQIDIESRKTANAHA
ncbi:MAG: hypothetical protein PF484_13370 [Bacteroidales bacterium]|jgi:hypothetical protein|nr:hypothetical protein [Bacteroidales bacterium]